MDDAVVNALGPLEADLEAVVLFVVKTGDDVVVCAHNSLNLLEGRIMTRVCLTLYVIIGSVKVFVKLEP